MQYASSFDGSNNTTYNNECEINDSEEDVESEYNYTGIP